MAFFRVKIASDSRWSCSLLRNPSAKVLPDMAGQVGGLDQTTLSWLVEALTRRTQAETQASIRDALMTVSNLRK